MDLGFFGHPGRLAERGDQLGGTRDELSGVSDAVSTLVVVPSFRHSLTLHRSDPQVPAVG